MGVGLLTFGGREIKDKNLLGKESTALLGGTFPIEVGEQFLAGVE